HRSEPTQRMVSSPRRPPRTLPSFPTRRSSDLDHREILRISGQRPVPEDPVPEVLVKADEPGQRGAHVAPQLGHLVPLRPLELRRSEEHTSELQSRENLVCRLLLEKKNTRTSMY